MVRRSAKGFTLVEIMIVVAIIGILIAIAVPSFLRAREISRKNACEENLSKIDGAIQQWALETKANNTMVGWEEIVGNTLYIRRMPVCPANGTYTVTDLNSDPTCDYDGGGNPAFEHIYGGGTGAGAGGGT